MNEKALKLEQLAEDPEFLEALRNIQGSGWTGQIFESYGVELTEEEVQAFLSAMQEAQQLEELTDTDLDNVSGGRASHHVVIWARRLGYRIGKKLAQVYRGSGIRDSFYR